MRCRTVEQCAFKPRNSEPLEDKLQRVPACSDSRVSLSARFLVVAAGVITIGMTLLGYWVSSIVERSIVHHAGATIAVYVETLLEPYRAAFKAGTALGKDDSETLDDALQRRLLGSRVRELKIWSRDGLVIYSTNKSQIGKRHPVTSDLKSAFAGNVEAKYDNQHFASTSASAAEGERLFEIYVPLRESGLWDVIAVAEIYETAEAVFEDIRTAQLESGLIVATIGLSMTAALYIVVKPASRLIEEQRYELTQRVAQLSSSLRETQDLRSRVLQANRTAAEVQERVLQQLSAELHDGPVQLIALALLHLGESSTKPSQVAKGAGTDEPRDSARERLEEALAEIRALSAGFALPDLGDHSLLEALTSSAARHERRTGTKVSLRADGEIPHLPASVVGTLYRFVQEGLTNAFRHANGHGQTVEIQCDAGSLRVTVADHGPGLGSQPPPERLGLRGMRSRVEALGGAFGITSSSRGTRVTAEFGLHQFGGADG